MKNNYIYEIIICYTMKRLEIYPVYAVLPTFYNAQNSSNLYENIIIHIQVA